MEDGGWRELMSTMEQLDYRDKVLETEKNNMGITYVRFLRINLMKNRRNPGLNYKFEMRKYLNSG